MWPLTVGSGVPSASAIAVDTPRPSGVSASHHTQRRAVPGIRPSPVLPVSSRQLAHRIGSIAIAASQIIEYLAGGLADLVKAQRCAVDRADGRSTKNPSHSLCVSGPELLWSVLS